MQFVVTNEAKFPLREKEHWTPEWLALPPSYILPEDAPVVSSDEELNEEAPLELEARQPPGAIADDGLEVTEGGFEEPTSDEDATERRKETTVRFHQEAESRHEDRIRGRRRGTRTRAPSAQKLLNDNPGSVLIPTDLEPPKA